MAHGGLASGWPIARIFGITIRVHASWIVIFVLLTFSLGAQIIPVEEWSPLQVWVLAVIGAVGFFACVVAHELAHSIVAHGAGISVEGITLFVFGGVARLRGEAHTPGVEFKVAIAGPLMSLILAAACGGMYYGLGAWLPAQARVLLGYLFLMNLALVFFNLVPGFPLDGGRVLRAALWALLGDVRRATAIASVCGKAFAGLLILSGVYLIFRFRALDLSALWLIVIGLFLWSAAEAGYRQVALHAALAGLTVRDVLQTGVVAVPPDLPLDRLVDGYFYQYRFHSFPVLEADRLVGTISLRDVQDVPRADWPRRSVRDAMRETRGDAVVHPQEDLEIALRKMIEEGRGHLPVVEDGRLVGIVTRHDMLTLLQLKTGLGGRAPPGPRV